MPARNQPERLTTVAIFLLVFVTHAICPTATSGDSRWIVPQMVSLLKEGNLDLNEYPDVLRAHQYYGIECMDRQYHASRADPANGCPAGTRLYSHFPYATVAVALPPFVAMDGVLRLAGPTLLRAGGDRPAVIRPLLHGEGLRISGILHAFLQRDYVHSYGLVEMVLASFLMGVTGAIVFLTGREFLPRWLAVTLALLFAYGTAAWSTGSRALWQHGPEMLLLAIALYLLVLAERHPALAAWSGVPLAMAYFIRPTGAIAAGVLGLYVLVHHRRWFAGWLLAASTTAIPFVMANFAMYHRLLQPYFTGQGFLAAKAGNAWPFLVALIGQCLSPSRGLFIFSPFLLFSLAGIWIAIRTKWQAPLVDYLAAILLLHWLVISAFSDWTAGNAFGPRYFSDVTPLFLFFLIPVLAEYRRASKAAVAAFALTAALAVAIHFRGAVSWDVGLWNLPVVNAARAWDWRDPQFLRGLFQ